jgi:uncharacterized protein (TIGR02996 family)
VGALPRVPFARLSGDSRVSATVIGVMLRDIIENPSDDVVRLAYADLLDEEAGGPTPRGEFIRVQCELTRLGPTKCRCAEEPRYSYCTGCAAHWPLRRREKELLTAENAMAWGPDRELWAAGLDRPFITLNFLGEGADAFGLPPNYVGVLFRRGFVASIHLSLADFLAHATALARLPLERVTLSDRDPARWGEWSVWYGARLTVPDPQAALARERHWLPRSLYDLLSGGEDYRSDHRRWPTRAAAVDALSTACLTWARSQPAPAAG